MFGRIPGRNPVARCRLNSPSWHIAYIYIINSAAAVIALVLLIVLLFGNAVGRTRDDRSAADVPKAHYANRKLIVDHTARTGISSFIFLAVYTYAWYNDSIYNLTIQLYT